MKKLADGETYMFRVCAVNSEGAGPWTECADKVKAVDPYGEWIVFTYRLSAYCIAGTD